MTSDVKQRDAVAHENLLSGRSRALGKRLLEQQCWCWGHDVRYAEGNLLLRYGFDRQRPPSDKIGATTYSLQLLPDCTIALWGFGLWYGERGRGAIFVNRSQFDAQYFPYEQLPAPVWEGLQIEALHRDAKSSASTCKGGTQHQLTYHLLQRALRWITDYEQWLLGHTSLEYRQKCLEAWSQRFVQPDEIVPAWQRLSLVIEKRQRMKML